jgi:hypothetical protein
VFDQFDCKMSLTGIIYGICMAWHGMAFELHTLDASMEFLSWHNRIGAEPPFRGTITLPIDKLDRSM